MKHFARNLLFVGLALLIVASACAVLGLWMLGSVAHHSVNLSINGEQWQLPDLQGWHWSAASLGGLLVAALLVLAVPLVLALAMALGGLGLFLALAAVLGVLGLLMALAFSPLWLGLLLAWWLLRRRPASGTASS